MNHLTTSHKFFTSVFLSEKGLLMSKRKVKLCKDTGCQNASTTMGFCRLHYLKNWQEIKREQKAKSVQNLNRYIEHVLRNNPDNPSDVIRRDLTDGDHFQEKAEFFMAGDDFSELMGDVKDDDIKSVLGHIKIDDSF